MKGIQALSQKKGQACCTHLLDVETGEYNLSFLSRVLGSQKHVVVNLCYRSQGLIVKEGNPLGIKGLGDVVKKGARFINRNEGSGTRVLLEFLLNEKGLDSTEIVGFNDEVNTHVEVALKVLFGEADVGMGIEYVAHLLPLDFIPLREERFDLVIPKELWHTHVMKDFLSYIDTAAIQKVADTLPGYNLKDTGKIIFES